MTKISKEGLEKLVAYKYKAGEYSMMDHVVWLLTIIKLVNSILEFHSFIIAIMVCS